MYVEKARYRRFRRVKYTNKNSVSDRQNSSAIRELKFFT